MSDLPGATAESRDVAGLLAEFDGPDALKAAAVQLGNEGFTRWDVHSPLPIHGIERAMGIRPTVLPWLVLAAGLVGGAAALWMQWWTSAVDYPLVVSGKPLFSLPANVPITFELIVLLSALAAFVGAMALGRLPRFSHFVLRGKRADRLTTDGLFISIEASDPKFHASATATLLRSLGARAVELCREEPTGRSVPRALPWLVAVVGVLALLPPLLIALARQGKSDRPRIHLVRDMDFQPKYKPQASSRRFADRRTMRPPVSGTIAVGNLDADEHFYLGYRTGPAPKPRQTDARKQDERDYFATFPRRVQDRVRELIDRGQERFDIYCATCHGLVGDGNGMTSLRAIEREEPISPTSLHVPAVRGQPVGKLFDTIGNGTGRMPGYAAQIPVEDRWAIVLYARALQRSQNARLDDVPKQIRARLR